MKKKQKTAKKPKITMTGTSNHFQSFTIQLTVDENGENMKWELVQTFFEVWAQWLKETKNIDVYDFYPTTFRPPF